MENEICLYELLNIAAGVDSGNLDGGHLDAVCIAYLEARGYVCLKRHTEAPTEPGRYVIFSKHRDQICDADEFEDRTDERGSFIRGGIDHDEICIGPLPEGK